MTTYIYADLLFLINLLADSIVLYLTSRFSGARSDFVHYAISVIFGALFGTIALCMELKGLFALISLVLVSLAMCFAAFGKKRLGAFIGIVFYFYFSSVILYGGVCAMYYLALMFFSDIFAKHGFILAVMFLCAAALLYIISSSLCRRAVKSGDNRVRVELSDGCKTYELDFLCDSANFAKDPFSGKPVTVVSSSSLDSELINALSGSLRGNEKNERYRHIKPRVIPMKTVSGTTLLYAFVPESMYICTRGKKHKIDSIIAIDTHDNAFFGNDGIIPEILLETI